MTCPTIAKLERELREYHASFVWRAIGVRRFTAELLEQWRKDPPGPPRPAPRLNDGEDYEHPRTGEAMLDGMRHPAL